ncbi:MobF family relaxase [Pseudonocardia terrae]|uniref:MobF family relaxase n=1 Tax=Pseudonocardia terrae TaxID=2905831 RepID=UPI0027DF258E|nr:MobF family relaxase [Pseudonocardia terrae]
MLSIATGHDPGYLTKAVAGGREGYYTGAEATGEPPGLWYGAGAELLGLQGQVDAELMEAVYSHLLDPRDPATHARSTWGEASPLAAGHRRYRTAEQIYADLLAVHPEAGPEEQAQLRARAERSARQAVAFYDVTFSAPKSVTVLGVAFERAENDARRAGNFQAAQAWGAHRRAVEDAVLAGARASIDYLADVAGYARVGHHGGGAGRWTDAHEWVVAQFLQHDSRDRDPQLHVHQAVLNRVPCADGSWRAIDGRAIHDHRGAAGAIGERVMEAHLTRTLGVRFATRPDGRAREIVGVRREVLELFSTRRRAVTAKTTELVRAFSDRFGREPSNLERTRVAQQATLLTRAGKSHRGETVAQRLDRWEAETRTLVAGGLAQVAHDVLDLGQQAGPAEPWSVDDVVERALAAVAERRQSWSRSDLTRAISDALPGHLHLDPTQVRELLDGLTDIAIDRAVRLNVEEETAGLPQELVRADGRSVYAKPGAARYTTHGQIAAERELRKAAVVRGAPALAVDEARAVVSRFAESGRELGADQAAAVVGVLSSGARVEVLSAAAGTGKSFTVAALADAWTATGRRVIGLAPSQIAAQVLAEEGLPAHNIARWLTSTPLVQAGDLVVVDEAGMATTADLARIHQHVADAGGKLLLVGDPRQLAAVGPGGALSDLGERGLRYELAEVRRFTHPWEATASLQLRDGNPAALDAYQRHGRIRDGGAREQTETAARRAWLADTLAGRESLLLVGSNEAAARLSAELRAELVALGRVAEHGVELTAQGTVAGVGDLVQARRNAWHLLGHDGNTRAPINRQTYRVTATRDDGGLQVTDPTGVTLSLPRGYVAEHLTLAYAATVHAAQGRTVDTAHAVLGPGTDTAALYVALTRGRHHNTAHVITRPAPEDSPAGQTTTIAPRTGHAVLADILDRDHTDRTALAEHEHAQHEAKSMRRHVDRLAAEIADATAGRLHTLLDRLTDDGHLTPTQRLDLAADPALSGLDRLLRSCELAGHHPDTLLGTAVTARSLDGADHPAQVLHARITKTLDGIPAPEITSYAELIPTDIAEHRRERLHDLADAADDRRHELGAETADHAPQWAIEALGRVPNDPVARAEWEHRAGWAAAYRELADHTDDQDPLGPPPPAGVAEHHAAWYAAHTALDLPDRGADEQQMTDGQLRVRVAAYDRERTWAPDWVADDLAAAHQQAQRHHTNAELWTARAGTLGDPAEREQLLAAAAEARDEAKRAAARAAELQIIDDARATWYAHTAVTRVNADHARSELAARGVDLDSPADQVTAQQWLDAHHADQLLEDQHREITGLDIAEDERQLAPNARTEQASYSTTDDSTVEAIRRAQNALAEIHAREQLDLAHGTEESAEQSRAQQLTLWAEQNRAQQAALEQEAAYER